MTTLVTGTDFITDPSRCRNPIAEVLVLSKREQRPELVLHSRFVAAASLSGDPSEDAQRAERGIGHAPRLCPQSHGHRY